jgi:hypothetical protein
MSFESKSLSMTACHLPDISEANWEDIKMRIVSKPVPNADSIQEEAQWGWAGKASAIQKPTMENIMVDQDIMHFRYTCLERKIPAATKNAHISLRSEQRREQTGMPYLSRKEKKEIRKDVTDDLLDDQPAQLVSIEVLYRIGSNTLFIGTTSTRSVDGVAAQLMVEAGFPNLYPMYAHERALVLTEGKSKEMFQEPLEFTEYLQEDILPGRDFLVWLWHSCVNSTDSTGGKFELDDDILFAAIGSSIHMEFDEKKVNFTSEVASASKGAIYALKSGFTPAKYKLKFGFREQVWKLTLDADTLSYGSVTLPDSEETDSIEHFRERVYFMEMLDSFINNLYFSYLDTLHTNKDELVDSIQRWIRDADLNEYF